MKLTQLSLNTLLDFCKHSPASPLVSMEFAWICFAFNPLQYRQPVEDIGSSLQSLKSLIKPFCTHVVLCKCSQSFAWRTYGAYYAYLNTGSNRNSIWRRRMDRPEKLHFELSWQKKIRVSAGYNAPLDQNRWTLFWWFRFGIMASLWVLQIKPLCNLMFFKQ